MTLDQIVTRIRNRRGRTANESAEYSYLVETINETIADISGRLDWPWLLGSYGLTVIPRLDATGDVTKGDTHIYNITPPDVSRFNNNGSFLSGGSPRERHEILYASGGSVTLKDKWIGESATGVSLTLWKDAYELPSTIDRVLGVIQTDGRVWPGALLEVHESEIDRVVADRPQLNLGQHIFWSRSGLGATRGPRIRFWPVPSVERILQLRVRLAIPALSAANDIPLLPARWHPVIVYGALARIAEDDGIDEVASARMRGIYEQKIALMIQELASERPSPEMAGARDEIPGPPPIQSMLTVSEN